MTHSRRSILAGLVALTTACALPVSSATARATITVYKDPG